MHSLGAQPASVSLDGLRIIQPSPEYRSSSPVPDNPDSPTKTSASTSSGGTPLSRRRSVSSMKGLMPLTLSSSASNLTTLILSEERMEQRLDDYLPELLARDLELSSDVFAARSMTAGAPSYSVVAEYMARAKAAGQFTNRLNMASPYQSASARVQVLGCIEERDSMASFLEQQEQQEQRHSAYPDTSDMDSYSSADESAGRPPPPFRYHRNTSITTAATSFTDSVRKQSPQPSQPPQPVHGSWIEGDSDDDSEVEHDVDPVQEPLSPLSPRPPTPPSAVDIDPFPLNYEQSAATFRTRILHKKSHSVTGLPLTGSSRTSPLSSPLILQTPFPKHLVGEVSLASRSGHTINRSLDSRQDQAKASTLPSHAKLTLAIPPPPVSMKHYERSSPMLVEGLNRQSTAPAGTHQPIPIPQSPPMSEGYTSDLEGTEDRLYEHHLSSVRRGNGADYSRPTPPASPTRNAVRLAHTAKPYVPNFHGDELARVVPLPPDVVETLRVSVACFPETMLLSSSLTIDTIRSYSRKMRHPDMDLGRISPPPSPESAGRRSLWRKVSLLKRSSSASLRSNDMHSINGSMAGNIGALDTQKAWSAIQNVFGTCSDYICDALYAHILAYNYVSALLARNAASAPASTQPRRSNSRRTAHHSPADKQDDIPRKAASLLGLEDAAEPLHPRNSRFAKRTSTATMGAAPWSRDELLSSQHTVVGSSGYDGAIRAVQEDLYKCIVRLIGTARLMSESGRLDEPVTDAAAADADVLLMKSLCEIVRLVEDTC